MGTKLPATEPLDRFEMGIVLLKAVEEQMHDNTFASNIIALRRNRGCHIDVNEVNPFNYDKAAFRIFIAPDENFGMSEVRVMYDMVTLFIVKWKTVFINDAPVRDIYFCQFESGTTDRLGIAILTEGKYGDAFEEADLSDIDEQVISIIRPLITNIKESITHMMQAKYKITINTGKTTTVLPTKRHRIPDKQFAILIQEAVKLVLKKYPDMLYEFGMIPRYKQGGLEFVENKLQFFNEISNTGQTDGIRVKYGDKYFSVLWNYDKYRKIYFDLPGTRLGGRNPILYENEKSDGIVEYTSTGLSLPLKPLANEIRNTLNNCIYGLWLNGDNNQSSTTDDTSDDNKETKEQKHEAVKQHCEELAKKHNIKFFTEFVAAFNRALCNTFNNMNPKSECYDDFTSGGNYVVSLMRNITGYHCWELLGSAFCDSHKTNTNPHKHLVSSHIIWSTPRRTDDKPYPEIGGPLMYIELYYDDEAGTITCDASTAIKPEAHSADWMFIGELKTKTDKFGMTTAEKMTIRKFSIPDCPAETNALNLVASKFNNTLNWAEIYDCCEFEEIGE